MNEENKKERVVQFIEEVDESGAPVTPETADAAPKRRSPTHKLYDKLGLSPSLRAVDTFILIMGVLLVVAVIIGILT